MHFEIASARIKRILYCWGLFANSVHLSLLGGSTIQSLLFCFDKLLFLTFLQLYKKKWSWSQRIKTYFDLSSFTQVNFQTCLASIKVDTLVNDTSLVIPEALSYASHRREIKMHKGLGPLFLNVSVVINMPCPALTLKPKKPSSDDWRGGGGQCQSKIKNKFMTGEGL